MNLSDTATARNIQKLQRCIVDGLEDVKAQDIQVFDTLHLSALFERVVVASGSSNRQTKALAASVCDAVRQAGFPKPRVEGEDNGEWIVVDCGAAVVHIMQPAIRQYYHLEEIWGDKPVRLKLGAPKPPAPAKTAAKTASKTAVKAVGKAAKKTATKTSARAATKNSPKTAAKATEKAAEKTAGKAVARKAAAKPATKKTLTANTRASRPVARKKPS